MYGFVIAIHVITCALLVVIILMQSGRGGGLTEGFAAAESMFGAKTNTVLTKGTTIMATVFLITCLSLAFMSTKKNQSLISKSAVSQQASDATEEVPMTDPNATASESVEGAAQEIEAKVTEQAPSQAPSAPIEAAQEAVE